MFILNSPLPTGNPTAGRIIGPNQAPGDRLVWRLGADFLGIYDPIGALPGRPRFRGISGHLKNTGVGETLSRGGNFCGNLEFRGKRKVEVPWLECEKGRIAI